ncbi:MAG: helix-turn-helix transcriptional regulator [Firmicutes bacterium]|nr:helix-turn-helix transcriptional regulator [Bacillota bacterium]
MFNFNNRQIGIIRNFFLSYFAILIIPILIVFAIYTQLISREQERALLNSEENLRLSKNNVEARLGDIKNISMQIRKNSTLEKILYGQQGFELYYDLNKYLKNIKHTNGYINEIYIYFKNFDCIVSDKGILKNPLIYYDNNYVRNNMSYDQWRAELFSGPYLDMFIRYGESDKTLSCLNTVPLDSIQEESKAVICIDFQEDTLKLQMRPGVAEGSFIILDKSKTMICASDENAFERLKSFADVGEDTSFIKDKKIVSVINSQTNDWIFVSSTNMENYFAVQKSAKGLFFLMIALMFVSGIVMSYILAHRSSTPIIRLLDALNISHHHGYRPSLKDAEGTVSSLLTSNQNLSRQLQARLPLMRTAFFERLVGNQFISEEELLNMLNGMNMDILDNYYCVVSMVIKGYDVGDDIASQKELLAAKIIVEKALYQISHLKLYVYFDSNSSLSILFSHDNSNIENETESVCDRVHEHLLRHNNIFIYSGMSNAETDITKVYKCYGQARFISSIEPDEPVIRFSSRAQFREKSFYYYPGEIENRLINLTMLGRADMVAQVFAELYNENYKMRSLSSKMSEHLQNEIIGTFFKIMSGTYMRQEMGIEYLCENMESIDRHQNAAGVWVQIVDIYKDMCRFMAHSKKKPSIDLKEQIISFIGDNYSNSLLNLSAVAEHFNMSEGYMSRFIKEYTGETFSYILEQFRISEATKLIKEGNHTIKTISEKVGYSSPQTFRRAYKRIYGILPSEVDSG